MDEEAGELQGQSYCGWHSAREREAEYVPDEVEFEETVPIEAE
jgi:hypothetical protein